MPEENTNYPAWSTRLAVFDLETTGLVLHEARIVTACVAEIDSDGQIIGEAREWLADPGIEIPTIAASVHGVTTEYAQANGRAAAEVVAEIIEALQAMFEAGIPVVAYNASYDFSILYYEALRYGIKPLDKPLPVVDPLVIDKYLDVYRSGKRNLETTAAFYQVDLQGAHNATADAVAAGRVAQAVARKFAAKLNFTPTELHDLQVDWSAANDASYENFRRKSDPSFTIARGWPIKLTGE